MLRKNANPILESPQFRAILKLLSFDSCLVLDLDNTCVEPLTSFRDLGSDQWFVKLIEYACKLIPDKEEAIAAVVAIYHEVQHHLRMKAVEPGIVNIICALQDIGIPVIGLTARDTVLKESTLRQLNEIGIDFRGHIIFCNGQDKGECFKEYLKNGKIKFRHVVMADDKEKHLLHVQKAVESLDVRFDGVRYSFLDERAKNVDMHGANTQLIHIKHKLTFSTQQIINKLQISSHNFSSPHPVSSDFYFNDEIKRKSSEDETSFTILGKKTKQDGHQEQCDNNNDGHHYKRRRNRY